MRHSSQIRCKRQSEWVSQCTNTESVNYLFELPIMKQIIFLYNNTYRIIMPRNHSCGYSCVNATTMYFQLMCMKMCTASKILPENALSKWSYCRVTTDVHVNINVNSLPKSITMHFCEYQTRRLYQQKYHLHKCHIHVNASRKGFINHHTTFIEQMSHLMLSVVQL